MKSTILLICVCILFAIEPICTLKQFWCGVENACKPMNAICLYKNLTCICPLGFQDEGDYCSKKYCRESEDCAADFPNSECVNFDCGACASGFYLDPEAQTCKAKHPINSACSADFQCGINATCSKELNRCVCESNQFTPLTTNCLVNHCDVREDCTSTLGYRSDCTQNGKCECTENYIRDAHTDQCVLKYRLIGENCTQQTDCGQNAFCLKSGGNQVGFCACKLAHRKLNEYQCLEFSCDQDKLCNSTWGFYGTHCNATSHRCACQEGMAVGASGLCEKHQKSTGYAAKSLKNFNYISLLLGIVLIFM